jgi:polysaccharide export outer membrane protein
MKTTPRIDPLCFVKVMMIAALTLVIGCAQTYTDYDAFVRQPRPLVSTTTYRIMPPDVILITSKRVRELNNHREQVRADGRITLPLLGSVFVAGKTTEQVSAELESAARDYYEDADVSLRVAIYASQKIFVFGEVNSPGPYPYTGANTILSTLARAQPSRLANPSKIRVLRPDEDGELVHRMTINLNDMVKQGDVSLNAVLEEGDIIFVPPTSLAAVGLAFQQLLLPIQPAAAVVGGPPDIYSSTRSQAYSDNGD